MGIVIIDSIIYVSLTIGAVQSSIEECGYELIDKTHTIPKMIIHRHVFGGLYTRTIGASLSSSMHVLIRYLLTILGWNWSTRKHYDKRVEKMGVRIQRLIVNT